MSFFFPEQKEKADDMVLKYTDGAMDADELDSLIHEILGAMEQEEQETQQWKLINPDIYHLIHHWDKVEISMISKDRDTKRDAHTWKLFRNNAYCA